LHPTASGAGFRLQKISGTRNLTYRSRPIGKTGRYYAPLKGSALNPKQQRCRRCGQPLSVKRA
ncbi:MAG: hypothetical protein PVF97_09665, partial [Desulfobacterales bacterium]